MQGRKELLMDRRIVIAGPLPACYEVQTSNRQLASVYRVV
jgi:hypothetical protein